MMSIINNIILNILKFLIFMEFSTKISKFNKKNYYTVIISTIVTILASFFFISINYNFYFIVLSFLYLSVVYCNSVTENLIISINYYIIFQYIEYFFYNFSLLIKHPLIFSSLTYNYLCNLIVIVTSHFIFTKIIYKIMSYKEYNSNLKNYFTLLILSIASLLCLITNHNELIAISFILETIVITLSSIMELKFEKEKNKIYKSKNHHLIKLQDSIIKENDIEKYYYYKKIHRLIKETNFVYNNILQELNFLLTKKLPPEIINYIKKIKNKIHPYENIFDTGVIILDMLLYEKHIKAKQQGINLKVTGEFDQSIILEPKSISLILENLININLELCDNIKSNNKELNISFYQDKEKSLFISIFLDNENSILAY